MSGPARYEQVQWRGTPMYSPGPAKCSLDPLTSAAHSSRQQDTFALCALVANSLVEQHVTGEVGRV